MFASNPAYRLHKLVFALDRAADTLLRAQLGISYKRALFLVVLQNKGTITQHELAVALGYSDPAVSTMLPSLLSQGLITVSVSQVHKRKRLVAITQNGSSLLEKGQQLLNERFDHLITTAGVDKRHYEDLTERIYQVLISKEERS